MPQAPLKRCITCGVKTKGTRCEKHTRELKQAKTKAYRANRPLLRVNDAARKRAVEAHRAVYGDVCPGHERPPHRAWSGNPLTADHLDPVAAGGREDGPLGVLCNQCNATKGASRV